MLLYYEFSHIQIKSKKENTIINICGRFGIPKNKKKHIGYISNIKRKIVNYVLDYKKRSECLDCGLKGTQYPEVLDFDHINNDKEFNISEFRRHTSGFNKGKKRN